MISHDSKSISVAVENLSFTAIHRKTKKEFNVLKDVSFVAQPGQLLAIMGPSGCGKSTLLNMMAGRILNGPHTSGKIYYSGVSECNPTTFSRYVMQSDHLVEYLTVKETLDTAAKLKMRGTPKHERDERVESVMKELGLWDCRYTLVGGHSQKGISGGERKRVSIALELIEDPRLLFLDEPTSGLDASRAYDTLEKLVHLARAGRTIVCTVHSPRSPIFALFGQILLLSKGQVVYHGPANSAIPYFSSQGFPCPQWCSPPDFILDLLTTTEEEIKVTEAPSKGKSKQTEKLALKNEEDVSSVASSVILKKEYKAEFLRSPPREQKRTNSLLNHDFNSAAAAAENCADEDSHVRNSISPLRHRENVSSRVNRTPNTVKSNNNQLNSSPNTNPVNVLSSPSKRLEQGPASPSHLPPPNSASQHNLVFGIDSFIDDEALSHLNRAGGSTFRNMLQAAQTSSPCLVEQNTSNVANEIAGDVVRVNSSASSFSKTHKSKMQQRSSRKRCAFNDEPQSPDPNEDDESVLNQNEKLSQTGTESELERMLQKVDTSEYLIRYTMPGLKPTRLEMLAAQVTAKEEIEHERNIQNQQSQQEHPTPAAAISTRSNNKELPNGFGAFSRRSMTSRHAEFSLGDGHRISLPLHVIRELPNMWTVSIHFEELKDRLCDFTDFARCRSVLNCRDELLNLNSSSHEESNLVNNFRNTNQSGGISLNDKKQVSIQINKMQDSHAYHPYSSSILQKADGQNSNNISDNSTNLEIQQLQTSNSLSSAFENENLHSSAAYDSQNGFFADRINNRSDNVNINSLESHHESLSASDIQNKPAPPPLFYLQSASIANHQNQQNVVSCGPQYLAISASDPPPSNSISFNHCSVVSASSASTNANSANIDTNQNGTKKLAKLKGLKRFLHLGHEKERLPMALTDLRKKCRTTTLEKWAKVAKIGDTVVRAPSTKNNHQRNSSTGDSGFSKNDNQEIMVYDMPELVRHHTCFVVALPSFLWMPYLKYKSIKLSYDFCMWLIELYVLTKRLLLGTIRQPKALIVICIQKIVSSLLLGWFYFQLGNADAIAANNRVGMLFWLCLNTTIALHSILPAFPNRRALVNKEIANGMYSRSAYYIAENIAALPWELFGNTLFFIIVSAMAGLNTEGNTMGVFVGIANLLVFTIIGIMTACSAVSPTVELANIVASLSILLCILTAGFYVHSDNIPTGMKWFMPLSYMRYSFSAFLQNDLSGAHFDSNRGATGAASSETIYQIANMSASQNIQLNCPTSLPAESYLQCENMYLMQRDAFIANASSQTASGFDGESVIKQLGFSDLSLGYSCVMLFMLGILYRVIGYIGFKYMHKRVGLEL
eukprot:GDKK01034734.1.p1 GENE.GDKK01034734.1~~GDKK01034734.1.p1  ORF type:complete len:1346 (-),score=308.78 GDKK01034734.1:1128-5165(-)